jgi:hypothetical protein
LELCNGSYNNNSHQTIVFDGHPAQCPVCVTLGTETKRDELERRIDSLELDNDELMDKVAELEDLLKELEATLDARE